MKKFALIVLFVLSGCSLPDPPCDPYRPREGFGCDGRYAINQYGVCICRDVDGGGVVK